MRRHLTIFFCALLLLGAAAGCSTDDGGAEALSASRRAVETTTTTEDPGPTEAEIERWNEQVLSNAIDLNTLNEAIWVNTTNEQTWIAKTNERLAAERAERKRREAAEAAAAAPSAPRGAPAPHDTPAASEQGTGRCGGDLPPCYVMMRESGGDIRAQNPTSTASGKWQFLNSTWAGYGGYAEAWLAPESVQDAKARILWAGGAGCSHWSAC